MPPKIAFLDPTVRDFYETTRIEISKKGESWASARANDKRWSDQPIVRVEAAAIYCALGVTCYDNEKFGDAAMVFHFAGHAFRTVWMEAKAAKLYVFSADCGAIHAEALLMAGETENAVRQLEFDLRSIGRATMAYRSSGQFERSDDIVERRNGLLEKLDTLKRSTPIVGADHTSL